MQEVEGQGADARKGGQCCAGLLACMILSNSTPAVRLKIAWTALPWLSVGKFETARALSGCQRHESRATATSYFPRRDVLTAFLALSCSMLGDPASNAATSSSRSRLLSQSWSTVAEGYDRLAVQAIGTSCSPVEGSKAVRLRCGLAPGVWLHKRIGYPSQGAGPSLLALDSEDH